MWFSDIPYTTCSLSLYVSGSSSVCALSVSFVLSFIPYFIFSALFMLFQVLCMYSITTKHKYLSGDVFLYPVMSSSLSSFTPPLTSLFFFLNVFSCPDSPLSLSLSLPVSLSPVWCLSGYSWKATVGRQADRAVWWYTEPTSAPRTWTMTTASASAPSCSLGVSAAKTWV